MRRQRQSTYRRRPKSQNMAYWQVIHSMERYFKGHSHSNLILIRRIAGIIKIIWRHHQIGLFQLKLKYLIDYINNHSDHISKEEHEAEQKAIRMLCEFLNKEHWLNIM